MDATVLRNALEDSNPSALRSRGDHICCIGSMSVCAGSPPLKRR
ncbi:hypothetical protein [Streptomyces angustmyceticus]